MAITKSSGREPWIFRVDHPHDLVAAHRHLIASSLQPDERILHLIYSPAWEGTEAPFGIHGHAASHAIALTPHRWIVSEDRHDPAITPSVSSIAFDDIVVLEKGSALLQAWFVLRYADNGALRTLTVLHKAIGSHHFDDAIRTYRSLVGASASPSLAESDEWQHIPRYLAQELMPVLIDGERVLASCRTSEAWHEERRRWRRSAHCARPWSSLLLTDRGIVYGVSETGERPHLLSFGGNIWCAPRDALQIALPVEKGNGHCRVPELRITLARHSVRYAVEAAIPSMDHAVVKAVNAHG